MTTSRCVRITSSVVAATILGSNALYAQPTIVTRTVQASNAVSSEAFGAVLNLEQMADSSVLINDGGRRQLLLLDPRLKTQRVVFDSVAGTADSYGPVASPLIRYLADSSLFIDGSSLTFVVIDPFGRPIRTMAPPKPADLRFMAGSPTNGVNSQGDLIYRGLTISNSNKSSGIASKAPIIPDSAPILRASFETRMIDTIGMIRAPITRYSASVQGSDGMVATTITINPLTTTDEWAVLTDGTVAFVRGHDYHVDWLLPTGRWLVGGKLPFDWRRVSDSEKLAIVDSTREAETSKAATARRQALERLRDAGAVARAPMAPPTFAFVPIDQMAEYYPAIRSGALKADRDGNLWILPTTSAQSKAGELLYDVVNPKDNLLYRVRLPAGRVLAGFGKGGIIYMMHLEPAKGWIIERSVLDK